MDNLAEINVTELRDYLSDKEQHEDGIAVIDTEQLAALLDAVEALRLLNDVYEHDYKHATTSTRLPRRIVGAALDRFKWEA